MTVGENWQGRVWGRTNCSFNSDGTAPGGNTRNGQACGTGDCGGIVNCRGTGVTPVTLAEIAFDNGRGQTFYDISLVDGYNLPMAIVMRPISNSSLDSIPPNLTNPSCVGTAGNVQAADWNPYTSGQGNFLGTNSSTPMPLENKLSVAKIASWCPTNLEVSPLDRPSSGVYTYPDGNIQRPTFDPCYSACAKNGQASDCCTGSYDSPSSCQPSAYSRAAKSVCPDAYSYAFDDQTSTFIIPAGAGFEIIFCPGGRSTNILATSKQQLVQLAQSGSVSRALRGMDLSALMLQPFAEMKSSHSTVHRSVLEPHHGPWTRYDRDRAYAESIRHLSFPDERSFARRSEDCGLERGYDAVREAFSTDTASLQAIRSPRDVSQGKKRLPQAATSALIVVFVAATMLF